MKEDYEFDYPTTLYASKYTEEFASSPEQIISDLDLDAQQLVEITTYSVVAKRWYTQLPVSLDSQGKIDECITMNFETPEYAEAACQKSLDSLVRNRDPRYPNAKAYKVTYSDSLSKIALAQYGKARLWLIIWRANRKIIELPDVLQVGQVLTIPEVK